MVRGEHRGDAGMWEETTGVRAQKTRDTQVQGLKKEQGL